MQAIVVADKNKAEIGTVETPTPGAGEICVRVKAAALNRADLLVLAGHQHGSVGGAARSSASNARAKSKALGRAWPVLQSATASCVRPATPSPNMWSPTPGARRKFQQA